MKDFVSRYLDYCDLDRSEAPAVYHRWTITTAIGALMGRQAFIQFGKSVIYPNQYIILMGDAGTRKGTAMGPVKPILKLAGYNRFSAARTSPQRFLMDMKMTDAVAATGMEDLEQMTLDAPQESFIHAPEFVDFIGQNNMDFVNLLTNLWDNLNEYEHPKIQGKSVFVDRPTVSMLSASTAESFALSLPPESIGSGFLSRVLLIHGEPNGNEIAWPEDDDELVQQRLAADLKDMRKLTGRMTILPATMELGKEVYSQYRKNPIDDGRYKNYGTRRFTHLLKLSMILAIADLTMDILPIHMIRANTMLGRAERRMPKALGEFGVSKHGQVANKILSYMASVRKPLNANELWRQVRRDVGKFPDMIEILSGLRTAGMIVPKQIGAASGYVLHHEQQWEWPAQYVDSNWLTEQEYAI